MTADHVSDDGAGSCGRSLLVVVDDHDGGVRACQWAERHAVDRDCTTTVMRIDSGGRNVPALWERGRASD